jgi:glutathione S-transferase
VAPFCSDRPGIPPSPSADGGNGGPADPWPGAANRPKALRAIALVDEALSDRPFIVGDRFTVADITGLVALDFAKPARIAIPPELANLNRWRKALSARPSAAA